MKPETIDGRIIRRFNNRRRIVRGNARLGVRAGAYLTGGPEGGRRAGAGLGLRTVSPAILTIWTACIGEMAEGDAP